MSAPAPEVQSQGDGERLGRAPARAAVWRLRHAAVVLMFFAFSLNSDPGRIFNDTKIDLVLNPRAFLSRAVNLWDPLGSAGQLQNQAYGYLFPMGPFFWLGDAVGLPGWATQRLWWGLLLTVSYTGFVVLSGRLGMARGWARMVAGVAYALWPLVLTVIGRSSVEVWPPALAPWILVPLVGLTARARPWRAAALSGLVILCLGGVNATVNLAAVLPTVVWLATRRLDRETLRLAAWWAGAALLATAWWAVPLIALGRYSPPFLDFIESASFTTSTTALVEVMRGTANWVAYLPDSGSRAGLALLTERIPLVSSLVIAIAGLVGVALRRTTERAWLVCMLFLGVLLVSLGHAGAIEGFFAADVRAALDGALAPLRNVHKFDVLIRLSLTLGLASALTAAGEGRTVAETRVLRPAVALAGAFAVAGTASSFFGLAAAPTRSFIEVPPYWNQAISWLKEHDAQGRTLLLPGSRFAEYYWGYTGDEPIQATDSVAWDVRNAVPLTDPSHVRWLDGIERRIADGRGGADLAPALAEGGVGYVLVRTDLAHGAQAATRPTVVRSALDSLRASSEWRRSALVSVGPGWRRWPAMRNSACSLRRSRSMRCWGSGARNADPAVRCGARGGGAEYAVQPGGTTSPSFARPTSPPPTGSPARRSSSRTRRTDGRSIPVSVPSGLLHLGEQ